MDEALVPKLQILDLKATDEVAVHGAASLLVDVFPSEAWPDLASGLAEVNDILANPDNVIRIATNQQGQVLGWVGALNRYEGNVWELHPLVVHLDFQGRGIGRALVKDLEQLAYERDVKTIYLGTDDIDNQTSLSGVDLYANAFEHIANIKNLNRHPFEFYQKVGFMIVGLIPDANGLGKPDIMMAKRVAKPQ